MADPVRLSDPAWLELLLRPRLGLLLSECMLVQPELDPEAGFGVLQPMAMWSQLGLDRIEIAFCRSVDTPTQAYTLLRALSLGYQPLNKLVDFVENGIYDFDDMAIFIRRTCKRFHVTGENNGNSSEPFEQH